MYMIWISLQILVVYWSSHWISRGRQFWLLKTNWSESNISAESHKKWIFVNLIFIELSYISIPFDTLLILINSNSFLISFILGTYIWNVITCSTFVGNLIMCKFVLQWIYNRWIPGKVNKSIINGLLHIWGFNHSFAAWNRNNSFTANIFISTCMENVYTKWWA